MKTLIVFLCLLFCSTTVVLGQNLSDENTLAINAYFQNQNTQVQPNVAADNTLDQKTKADINITQTGNYNSSYIISNSHQKQEVNQQGDYNSYEFYSYYNSEPSDISTLQLGDNNSVQVFGQNKLAKNIHIIQNTNNKTLIIKNY